jgi:hypothetical protein
MINIFYKVGKGRLLAVRVMLLNQRGRRLSHRGVQMQHQGLLSIEKIDENCGRQSIIK